MLIWNHMQKQSSESAREWKKSDLYKSDQQHQHCARQQPHTWSNIFQWVASCVEIVGFIHRAVAQPSSSLSDVRAGTHTSILIAPGNIAPAPNVSMSWVCSGSDTLGLQIPLTRLYTVGSSTFSIFLNDHPLPLTETLYGLLQSKPQDISFPKQQPAVFFHSQLMSSSASSLCCSFKLCISLSFV